MKNEHLFIAQVELKTISRLIFGIKYLILKTIKKISVAMLDQVLKSRPPSRIIITHLCKEYVMR
jgi:hypothetical protein